MKITEKIVTSVTPPQLINVAWHNPETGELKMFGNKGWEVVGGKPGDDSGDSDSLCSGTCGGYPIVDAKYGRISFEVDDNLNIIEGTDKYGFSEVWRPNTWYNCLHTSDPNESSSLVLITPPGDSLYFFTVEYIPCGDSLIDMGMELFLFPIFLSLGLTGVSITYDETSEKPYLMAVEFYGEYLQCNISSLDLNTTINAELILPGAAESMPFMFKWTSITNKAKLIYIPYYQLWVAYSALQPNDHEYWTKIGTVGNDIFYINETDGMLHSHYDDSHTAYKILEYILDDNTSNIPTTKEYICNTNVTDMETNIPIIWASEPPTFDGSSVITLSVVDEVGCYTVK